MPISGPLVNLRSTFAMAGLDLEKASYAKVTSMPNE